MKNYILLAIALVAGFLAFFISRAHLNSKRDAIIKAGVSKEVIVAKRDLEAGDIIQLADIAFEKRLVSNIDENEYVRADLEIIIQQKLRNNVLKGTTFRFQDFDTSLLANNATLAGRIRGGQRAISIAVDNVTSVSNMIRVNNHVDILGTFRFPGQEENADLDMVTYTLLQNVTVLAVGQDYHGVYGTQHSSKQKSYSTITLSVSPAEAEFLVFAQQKGRLSFALRNGRDTVSDNPIQAVNFKFMKDNLQTLLDQRASSQD